jgi:hypothetical protein
MFSTAYKGVTGVLDRRFLLHSFLPVLAFWALLLWLWRLGRGEWPDALHAWLALGLEAKGLEVAAFLAFSYLTAWLLASRAGALLRLYEGYWDFPGGRWLADRLRGRHQARLGRLAEALKANPRAPGYEEIYGGYPLPTQPGEVMPTRLGNVLKNAELYARDRYRVNAVLLWPRLFPLLPRPFAELVAEARSGLDFLVLLSALGVAFGATAGVGLLALRAPWLLTLEAAGGGLAVAALAYGAAVGQARVYGQLVKSAFDLYRFRVLKQLRLPLPGNPDEEETLWQEVCGFLYTAARAKPGLWAYTAPPTPPGRKEKEKDEE